MRFIFLVPGMPLGDNVLERGTLGGSETSGLLLSAELVKRGHEVHVFGNLQRNEEWRGVKLLPMGPQNQATPHGAQYMAIADAMPHDALIVQRMPQPFTRLHAGRVQLWWLHDLARRRLEPALRPVRWACDGVLTPSDWHGDQVAKVFKNVFKREDIHTIRNGVDTALYAKEPNYARKRRAKRLLYSSRPERGLVNLVKPGGIMAQMAELDPQITLQVCTYDNPVLDPRYQQLYAQLEVWARQLPNVELLRPQTKSQLADLMLESALLVYPTVPRTEHEETSCISVMEAQCAGTPVIACDGGAVSETLGDGDGTLIPYLPDSSVDIGRFAVTIQSYLQDELYEVPASAARERALKTYTYEQPAAALEALVAGRTSPGRHRPALLSVAPIKFPAVELMQGLGAQLERARLRGQRIALIGDLPGLQDHLKTALEVVTDLSHADLTLCLDAVQPEPLKTPTLGWLLGLNATAKPGTRIAVAAVMGAPAFHPYAPWALDPDVIETQMKALGLDVDMVPASAVRDLDTGSHAQWGWVMWTAKSVSIPSALDPLVLDKILKIGISLVSTQEMLSVLMIVKGNAEIGAVLESVRGVADEVIIGVDANDLSGYWSRLEEQDNRIITFPLIHRPLIDGFAAARNEVLDRCTGDWVLWIDADETLSNPRRLLKYLRPNGLEAYAVPHRHLAADSNQPGNVLKLDLPTRLFRRESGLRFNGLVHEHPCHLPDSVPRPIHLVDDFEILHPGYYNEAVRRARFTRNLPLMMRDRKENPDRTLGKFLMIRDLAQLVRWERQEAGENPDMPLRPQHLAYYEEGLALWRSLIDADPEKIPSNMLGECVQFITELTIHRMGGEAIQFSTGLRLAKGGLGDLDPRNAGPEYMGALPTVADLKAFVARIQAEKLKQIIEEDYL